MMSIVLLSGCDRAAPLAQAAEVAGQPNAPALAQGAQPPAMPASTEIPPFGVPAAVRTLFDHVKRLNAACVDAGGGVSGSPDCDAAVASEAELERLGYCIDYVRGEALTTCSPASQNTRDPARPQ